jgi:hypothetical protein
VGNTRDECIGRTAYHTLRNSLSVLALPLARLRVPSFGEDNELAAF